MDDVITLSNLGKVPDDKCLDAFPQVDKHVFVCKLVIFEPVSVVCSTRDEILAAFDNFLKRRQYQLSIVEFVCIPTLMPDRHAENTENMSLTFSPCMGLEIKHLWQKTCAFILLYDTNMCASVNSRFNCAVTSINTSNDINLPADQTDG